jgi:hypothetical protein
MCQLSWSDRYLEVDDNGERPTRRHVDDHSFAYQASGRSLNADARPLSCLLLPRLVASRPTAGSIYPEFTAPPAKGRGFCPKKRIFAALIS